MMDDPTALIAKLQSNFENARNTGDLHFFPSTVVTHTDSDIEVIVIVKSLEPLNASRLLIMSIFDLVRDPALSCFTTKISTYLSG